MDDALKQRLLAIEPFAQTILQRLGEEAAKIGFDSTIALHTFAQAQFHLAQDPADGSYSLQGEWRDAGGHKHGNLVFHADGSFLVEHDIVLPHPRKPQWFVEAVTAWGKAGQIKTEPRLLPMPE